MRHNMKYSLKSSPSLRVLRSTQSVRLGAFINNKISEDLGSFSRQKHFFFISLKYKRIKHWLKSGVHFDAKTLREIDRVLEIKNINKKYGSSK